MGIMKTLSKTFVFVVLAIVGIVAVLALRAFAQPATPTFVPRKFTLTIGKTPNDFVDVKDIPGFKALLRKFGTDQYEIGFKDHEGATPEHYPPPPRSAAAGIKTDKVTTPEIAKNAPAGKSSANDPNAVTHLTSDSITDIEDVLKKF